MTFSGKVGDTFTQLDNPPYSRLYVIITEPNENGKIVVVSFIPPIKSIPSYVVFDGRHWAFLKGKKTIHFADAKLSDREKIIEYLNDNPNKCKEPCPQDIIRQIVDGAFKARLSPRNVLNELKRQYPDIAKKYPTLG